MDPREDIALAFDDPALRRTSVAPPGRRLTQVRAPAPVPMAGEPPPTGAELPAPQPEQTGAAQSAGEELPGRRRNRLQYLELYVTGRAYDLLGAQRDVGRTMGQATIEALRHSRRWLLESFAPPAVDDDDDFFPAPRRSHRRFHVDGGRHISAGVTPGEAAAVSRLAEQADLTLSELVSVAVEHHFGDSPA